MSIKSYLIDGQRVKIGSKAERELLRGRNRPSTMEGLQGATSGELRTGSFLNKTRDGQEVSNLYTPKKNKDRTLYGAMATGDYSKYDRPMERTVLSDSNIRDNVIPDLNSRANKMILGTDPNAQRPGETPEQYNLRITSNSSATSGGSEGSSATTGNPYEDMLNGLGVSYGGVQTQGTETVDPIETQSLNLLKKMQESVDANANAQLRGIEKMYDVRKQQMGQSIAGEGAALRTALRQAGSRYTPGSSGGAMTGQEQQGILRLAELDAEEQSAIADVKSAQQQGNFQLLEKQLAIAEKKREEKAKARQELLKTIADNNAEIAKAKAKIVDDVNKIAQDAAKGGASPDVIDTILASKDVGSAIKAAGSNLVSGSGVIGEYLFYKREAEAKGQVPMDFNSYADMDANRKRSIVNMNSGGLNTTQSNQFIRITDKYQADPLITAVDKGNTALQIADQIIADPGNAANQLKALYVLVKNLDPDSAVREGEISLANKTQSYLQTWGSAITRVGNGQVIAPDTAKKLAEATKELVGTWQDTAKQRTNRYKSQAKNADPAVGTAFESYLTDFDEFNNNDNVIESEAQAEQALIQYGQTNPDKQALITSYLEREDPLLGRQLTYSEILQLLGVTQ